jgi:hypothetical protein
VTSVLQGFYKDFNTEVTAFTEATLTSLVSNTKAGLRDHRVPRVKVFLEKVGNAPELAEDAERLPVVPREYRRQVCRTQVPRQDIREHRTEVRRQGQVASFK